MRLRNQKIFSEKWIVVTNLNSLLFHDFHEFHYHLLKLVTSVTNRQSKFTTGADEFFNSGFRTSSSIFSNKISHLPTMSSLPKLSPLNFNERLYTFLKRSKRTQSIPSLIIFVTIGKNYNYVKLTHHYSNYRFLSLLTFFLSFHVTQRSCWKTTPSYL